MVMGTMAQSVELAIVGGGPGGYVAAIRAAQLGIETVLVEKEHLGGVCLNWGCIPSKALIEIASLRTKVERFAALGIFDSVPALDLGKAISWKNSTIERLRTGIGQLLAKQNIEIIKGEARFTGQNKLAVSSAEGFRALEFRHAIIATGSVPIALPLFPFSQEEGIIHATHALSPQRIPEQLAVIGAGVIGLELGLLYRQFGAKVTFLEAAPALLPSLDRQLADLMRKSLKRRGIDLHTGVKITGRQRSAGGSMLSYEQDGRSVQLEVQQILVAAGRRPYTEGLGLEQIGLEPDQRGYLPVNERCATAVKGIYAIGDVTAGPMLAHRASQQGKIAAEVIAGKPSAFDNIAIPAVIFTDPEIASTGLTEEEARKQGVDIQVGVFPFRALGRALTMGEDEGMVKIIAEKSRGNVLGVHIMGPHASELVAEATLAIEAGLHFEDLAKTIHAHPTLAESLGEAAEDLEAKAIHIFKG